MKEYTILYLIPSVCLLSVVLTHPYLNPIPKKYCIKHKPFNCYFCVTFWLMPILGVFFVAQCQTLHSFEIAVLASGVTPFIAIVARNFIDNRL